MSRATARAGIEAFLDGQVAGVNNVYRSLPTIQQGSSFISGPGIDSGANIFVFIESERETRISLPAQYGTKRIVYTVGLVIEYFWVAPGSVGGGGEDPGVLAMDAFDAMIEALKERIRSDLTCGGTFFTWGNGPEGNTGAPDLTMESSLPVQVNPAIAIFGTLKVSAVETIQA